MSNSLSATAQSQRFQSLDLIRGVAVLGILIMNINAFGNIFAYYINPYAVGEPSQSDLWVWSFNHLFADQKFYTLFSMLFGAGIMLMAERARQKELSPAKFHYRRILWLIAFGLIHALLIWYGDILLVYGIMGLWVYLFVGSKPRTKLITGLALILLYSAYMSLFSFNVDKIPEADLQFMYQMFIPDAETIAAETLPYQTSYSAQLEHRLDFFAGNALGMILMFGTFRVGGSMLIGMALYQYGILSAQKSTRFYWLLVLVGFGLGLPIMAWDIHNLFATNFAFDTMLLSYMVITSLAALLIALGYIGLLALWVKCSMMSRLRKALANVGRMAFTNYIAQSLICTSLFYSYGLGWFGQLSRLQLMAVVLAVFLVQLLWSNWWLKRFHYGPLEWFWRTLTYGKRQAFRKH